MKARKKAKARSKVDAYGDSPLHLETDPEKVRELIAAGADLEAKNNEVETPLLLAAQIGPKAKVEILLEAGADITARTEWGYCALHLAGNRGIAEILIQGGILEHLRRKELEEIHSESGDFPALVDPGTKTSIEKEITRRKEKTIKSLRKSPDGKGATHLEI
jgi:hypothetical protein